MTVPLVDVKKISHPDMMQVAFRIRTEVFVEEQNVPAEDELDEFEDIAIHFLAFIDQKPVGTARYRYTGKGIKFERFAVLKPYRQSGVGRKLVEAVINDIQQNPDNAGLTCYLHGQVRVVGFYEKFGFRSEGDQFDECGIMHYLMKRHMT